MKKTNKKKWRIKSK